MKLKTIIAAAIAGAFALPLAAQASADNDRMLLAQAGGPSGASAVGSGATGGTASPQSAGEPRLQSDRSPAAAGASTGMTGADRGMPSFSTLDKNSDGQISRAEWDAHEKSGGGASGGASTSPSTGGTSSGASAAPGTTGGPGSVSNKTAPSAATATSPSTSGQGTPK